MKKFVLSCTLLAIASFGTRLMAQCTITNFDVVIKSITGGSGSCQVTMDVTFTGNFNSGNKYAFIHLWESLPVNNYPNLTFGTPPTAAQLANAAATIVISEPGKTTASLNNIYPPDPSVPVKFTGVTFSKSGTSYAMNNVTVSVSTCTQPVTLKGDIWASQAGNAGVVHCFNTGSITLLLNNPQITGYKECIAPRMLSLSFANNSTSIDESVVTEVFIDVNKDGNVDGGDIDITSSLSPALPDPLVLSASSTKTFTDMSYLPYSSQGIYDDKPIIVRATASAPEAASITITKNNIDFLGSCISLPVTLKSFTANRDKSLVTLKWQTASEQNSFGFAVERNFNGTWEQVAFVPSRSSNGTSDGLLNYKYDEVNTFKKITQYRLRQIDIDTRISYSEVRIIRPQGQSGKITVYPNPTTNGKVNIVFEQTDVTRDITLVDITGRLIKTWNNTLKNNLEINDLTPGMYNLRVVIRETGDQSVTKIVVTNR